MRRPIDERRVLMVSRFEANEIPHLLVAPKQITINSDTSIDKGNDESRGYYEDGAYIAAPVAGPQLPAPKHDFLDHGTAELKISPQEAYTKRLLPIFRQQ